MKQLTILISIISIFLLACQEQESREHRIFLDYWLGMSEHEYDSISKNLISVRSLQYSQFEGSEWKSTETGYTYDFVLGDGTVVRALLDPRFEDYGLKYLDLEFLCLKEYSLSTYQKRCGCSQPIEELEKVLSLYTEKYGAPEKDPYSNKGWIWKRGKSEIQFSIYQPVGVNACHDKTVANGGKVSYQLTGQEVMRLEMELLNEKVTKTEDF